MCLSFISNSNINIRPSLKVEICYPVRLLSYKFVLFDKCDENYRMSSKARGAVGWICGGRRLERFPERENCFRRIGAIDIMCLKWRVANSKFDGNFPFKFILVACSNIWFLFTWKLSFTGCLHEFNLKKIVYRLYLWRENWKMRARSVGWGNENENYDK